MSESTIETRKNELDLDRALAEVHNLNAETRKMFTEMSKITAETEKIRKETFWYPLALAIGIVATISGATAGLIKLLS